MRIIITFTLLMASGMLPGTAEEKKPAASGETVPARGNEAEVPPSSCDGAWGMRVGTPALHGGAVGRVGQVFNLSGGWHLDST